MNKLFEFMLTERNGGWEYSTFKILYAPDQAEAERIANDYARTYFGPEPDEIYGDNYCFSLGTEDVSLRVGPLWEIDIEQWEERSYRRSLIN